MIHKIKIGIMGTVEFHGNFTGMRKEQDFIVYPMHEPSTIIKVQSDTRVARICLDTGAVCISGKPTETLTDAERVELREWVRKSGSKDLVGSTFVKSDNSGALAL